LSRLPHGAGDIVALAAAFLRGARPGALLGMGLDAGSPLFSFSLFLNECSIPTAWGISLFAISTSKQQGASQHKYNKQNKPSVKKHTLESLRTIGRIVQRHERPGGELPGEAIKQRKNKPLMIARIGWSRPIRYLCGTPRPEQRKTRLTDLVEKVTRSRRLHKHFKEILFEVLVRGRERLK